jgi:GT2 family glycosyltransferase
MIKVTILIPVYNHIEQTKITIKNLKEQIFKYDDINYVIIIIDDGSTDGTSDWIKINHKDIIVLKGSGNLWWSGATNIGAKYALYELESDFVLLWNNDIAPCYNYFKNLSSIIKDMSSDTIMDQK